MRRRTVRSGLRVLLVALGLIILASFFHDQVAGLLSLSLSAEQRFYSLGIFWAAALGGYGVMLAAFGLILPATPRDSGVRVLPLFLMLAFGTLFFFYLFIASFTSPMEQRRVPPGTTITI